jgi:hypothetical protein
MMAVSPVGFGFDGCFFGENANRSCKKHHGKGGDVVVFCGGSWSSCGVFAPRMYQL